MTREEYQRICARLARKAILYAKRMTANDDDLDFGLRHTESAGPYAIAQLLAVPRAAIRSAKQLVFAGVPGKDVYNPTAPFDIAGNTVLAARVESPERESDSQVVFFEQGPHAWTTIAGAPRFELQDPAVTTIAGTLVLAGVEVWGEEGALEYKTVFYRGSSLTDLTRFAEGPIGMKDIRLAALDDGRVFVLTRPQGVRGGRGKIGYAVLDSLDALDADVLDDAPIISGQFVDEEWGGANEIVQLGSDKLGVLGHIARFDARGGRHYYPIAFEIDLAARRVTPPRILFERAELPGGTNGPAKRPDLRNVLFSGGIVRHADGTATIYVGAGDKIVYAVKAADPWKIDSVTIPLTAASVEVEVRGIEGSLDQRHEHWIDVYLDEYLPDIDADVLLAVTSHADAWLRASGSFYATAAVRATAAFQADVWDAINRMEQA